MVLIEGKVERGLESGEMPSIILNWVLNQATDRIVPRFLWIFKFDGTSTIRITVLLVIYLVIRTFDAAAEIVPSFPRATTTSVDYLSS
jgi:hypothetical protein